MKALERSYSKTERIIAKAKFSAVVYFRCVLLAVILGVIIFLQYEFRGPICAFIAEKLKKTIEISDFVLKMELLAAGILVIISILLTAFSIYRKECIVTETKVVFRKGLIARDCVAIPIASIANIEIGQRFFQRIFNMGKIIVVPESGKIEEIKGVVAPDRLMRRILQQANAAKRESESKRMRLLLSDGSRKK